MEQIIIVEADLVERAMSGAACEETFDESRPRAEAKGLALILEDGGADAVCDAKWTVEAVGNLVDNAIKYTAHGEIRLSVRSYELFSCICVADSGMGISEADQAQIFGRFYRAPASARTEGVGLGLHLTREIAARQTGRGLPDGAGQPGAQPEPDGARGAVPVPVRGAAERPGRLRAGLRRGALSGRQHLRRLHRGADGLLPLCAYAARRERHRGDPGEHDGVPVRPRLRPPAAGPVLAAGGGRAGAGGGAARTGGPDVLPVPVRPARRTASLDTGITTKASLP